MTIVGARGLVVGGALALAVTLAAGEARADDPDAYLNLGVLFSFPIGGPMREIGIGAEVSWNVYPSRDGIVSPGAFLQVQGLLGGGFRFDVGAQASVTLVGAELGLAAVFLRGHAPTFGAHLAGYASAGYLGVAARWFLPLDRADWGWARTTDLTVAAKFPLLIRDGQLLATGACAFVCSVEGRPLVIDARPRTATVVTDARWQLAPISDGVSDGMTVDPPDHLREVVAAKWERAALAEHASIAAFARLTLQLMALGAPPALLARTQQAALDEVDHARRCFTLASRFAGRAVGPSALSAAVAPIVAVDHATLAVATLREGCLGESVAADVAAHALTVAVDAEVRVALEVIARDEAAHAGLAWALVDWCIASGGAPVRAALAEALRTTPAAGAAADDGAALSAWGVASSGVGRRCADRRRREAQRRYGAPRPRVTAAWAAVAEV